MPDPDCYTPKELAAKLGCCVQTIYRAIRKKQIRPLRVGRVYRIPAKDVENLRLA